MYLPAQLLLDARGTAFIEIMTTRQSAARSKFVKGAVFALVTTATRLDGSMVEIKKFADAEDANSYLSFSPSVLGQNGRSKIRRPQHAESKRH